MNEIIDFLSNFWAGLPSWVHTMTILAIGLGAAVVARLVIGLFLRLVRFEKLCERIGFSEFLRKGGTEYTAKRLVEVLVFWVITLIVLMEVSRQMQIEVINAIYSKFLNTIPSLIAAALILISGWVILGFFANFVMTVAKNAGSQHARLFGRLIRYVGLLLILILALGQIEIGTGILGSMLLVLFSAICFGFALALGLGCQELVRDTVQRIVRDLREKSRQGKSGDLEG